MAFHIKTASTPKASAEIPTFDPSWLQEGEEVPEGTIAIALPADMFAAWETLPIIRSKGGLGASAAACRLGSLPPLTFTRDDGSQVDVKVPVSCYTSVK